MNIYPLFSSSSANCCFVSGVDGSKEYGVLVDAGASYKRLTAALKSNEIDKNAVRAVFVTHEHSDHISGLKLLLKNFGIPVFAPEKTLTHLIKKDCFPAGAKLVPLKKGTEICGIFAEKFNTPHDAVSSCGYRFTALNGDKSAVCTDLGYITETVRDNLYGCDNVLIESNYNDEMLYNGPYPWYLKDRILSNKGHLSNEDSGRFVRELLLNGTRSVILGHLSRTNNTPQRAFSDVSRYVDDLFGKIDFKIDVAPVSSENLAVNNYSVC